jgi:hypothetical protein
MTTRAINVILSDELEKLKKKDNVIEIILNDGEMLRIFGEYINDGYLWSITHALPSRRRYFCDIDSPDKEEILAIVNRYKVKSISLRNGPELYSESKFLKRMKGVFNFGKSKYRLNEINKMINYLKK